MMTNIKDYLSYKRCKESKKELCRRLSNESRVKAHRIYSLMNGRRAKNNAEMLLLFRMRELKIIREVRY